VDGLQLRDDDLEPVDALVGAQDPLAEPDDGGFRVWVVEVVEDVLGFVHGVHELLQPRTEVPAPVRGAPQLDGARHGLEMDQRAPEALERLGDAVAHPLDPVGGGLFDDGLDDRAHQPADHRLRHLDRRPEIEAARSWWGNQGD